MFTLVKDVANGLSVFERGLLVEVSDLNPFTEGNLARICDGGVHQRIHQGALTRTIFSDDGNFLTLVNTKGDVLIQRFNAVGLAYFMYRKKVFCVQFFRLLLFIHFQRSDPSCNSSQIFISYPSDRGHRWIIWPIFWHRLLDQRHNFFLAVASCGNILVRGTDELLINFVAAQTRAFSKKRFDLRRNVRFLCCSRLFHHWIGRRRRLLGLPATTYHDGREQNAEKSVIEVGRFRIHLL